MYCTSKSFTRIDFSLFSNKSPISIRAAWAKVGSELAMLLINLVNVGSFRGGKVIVLKINDFLENKSRMKKFFSYFDRSKDTL